MGTLADIVIKNATYVDVLSGEIRQGDIAIADGTIIGIGEFEGKANIDASGLTVIPGLIDAHIHLESSMVAPAEFAKAVLPHGTTAVATDPHEIANVMGFDGIEYLLEATENLPVDVFFELPSCIPATPHEENGCDFDYNEAVYFYDNPRFVGLGEMMNYPGVIAREEDILKRIEAARTRGLAVDGHAPGLSGAALKAYVAAGIRSDHECTTAEEAQEKIDAGMSIMIREGTAAHNLDALLPILTAENADAIMFCSDDKHPSDLLHKGHIDTLCRRAIAAGVDPVLAVKAATINAARYFKLEKRGAIALGYKADLVILDSLENFNVRIVIKNGKIAFDDQGLRPFDAPTVKEEIRKAAHRTFDLPSLTPRSFSLEGETAVLGVVPGELATKRCGYASKIDPENDILKIAVVERHRNTGHIGVGFICGYGLKGGAIATSIAHDAHNLIIVGTNEEDMALAGNFIAENEGGIAVVRNGKALASVSLPIAGLMSEEPLETVNEKLERAKAAAFSLGVSKKIDPFMTLSFMSLTVIPELRITTKGMFDVATQQFCPVRKEN